MKKKSGFFIKRFDIFTIALSSLMIFGFACAVIVFSANKAKTADFCASSKPINTTTFIKSYHLRDLTDGFDVVPTKDGGFILTGDTIWSTGMSVPNPFAIKTNAKGVPVWSRQFSSQSLPPRDSSTRHEPHVSVETSDGNIITATDILDFIDSKYESVLEVLGDILVTKINSKGTQVWSIMLGDYSVDRPQKIWAMPDGGVMLLARFAQTGYGNDVADISAVPKYSVLIRIDKNGKVLSSKKMGWEALDMQFLQDGGFIALTNIALPKVEQPEGIIGPEVTMGDLPTIIKFNNSLGVEWAKSLEMIPSEMNTVTSYASSTFTMGKTKIRIMGGDFRAVQPTPDGGFLAVGFDNLLLTKGLNAGSIGSITSFTPHPFVIVKVDAAGTYQWARKLSIPISSDITSIDFQMVRTSDGEFVIMQDVVHDSDGIETKPLAEMVAATASNIELIKMDAEGSPRWIKQFEIERALSGFRISPTVDKGVIVSGSFLTTKMHKVMLSMEPYKEAALIKIDANGVVGGYAGIEDHSEATVEDQSQYLVMQNMDVGSVQDTALRVNQKVKEKVWTIKDTPRDISAYRKSNVSQMCSYLTSMNAVPSGQPTAKTWAQINYDNTKEAVVEGEKNQNIHQELLPILNQVYHNQVKVKDTMKSMWLTYIFSRLTTRADVEAVQKAYEDLGYTVDESTGGNLWVSKVGQTLHMTFSTQDSMVGKLEVLF
jgi:hypothetical protein